MSKTGKLTGELPEPMESEVQPRHESDKFSFDFFRRYQKAILYTAGIFALVTFSITGAMTQAVGAWFAPKIPMPTMRLADGTELKVTAEDYEIAHYLQSWDSFFRVVTMPSILQTEEQRSHGKDIYASLRRLAIHAGIDASQDEADRAIAQAMAVDKAAGSAATYAYSKGGLTLNHFRNLVTEALRIGTFLRLSALGIDTSEASAAEAAKKEHRMLTLSVASLDKKAIEKRIKDAGVKDEDIKKWLETQTEDKKSGYQDMNRIALKAPGIFYAEFDPQLFSTELAGKTWGDEVVRQRYDLDKESRYRIEPASKPSGDSRPTGDSKPGSPPSTQSGPQTATAPSMPSYTPLDDPLKSSILKELQAEDALRVIWGNVQQDLATFMRPQVEARTKAGEELAAARKAQTEAEKKLQEAKDKLDQKAKDAWAKVETELKEALDIARNSVEEKQKKLDDAKAKLTDAEKDLWTEREPQLNLELERARKAKDEARRVAAIKQDEASKKAYDDAKKKEESLDKERLAGNPKLKEQNDALEAAKKDQEQKQKKLDAGSEQLAKEQEAVEQAKKLVETKSDEQRDAELRMDEVRKGFDAVESFQKHWAGRKALRIAVVNEPKSAEGLKDLPDLGPWKDLANGVAIDTEGDLSTQLQRTKTGCFFFQVTKVDKRPMKEFAEIREKLVSDFAAKQADDEAKAKGKKLQDALLRLGKEAQKEEVAKLQKEQDTERDKRFASWSEDLQKQKDQAAEFLKTQTDKESRAYKAYSTLLADATKELDDKDGHKKKLDAEFALETEKKMKDLAKKSYRQVLKPAAEEAGFAYGSVGPYTRRLSASPRFSERWPANVKFLWARPEIAEMKAGDVVDLVDDPTERASYVAVCETAENATIEQLSRRQILDQRDKLASERMGQGLSQSFTIEALKQRYGFSLPDGRDDAKKGSGAESKPSTSSQTSTDSTTTTR